MHIIITYLVCFPVRHRLKDAFRMRFRFAFVCYLGKQYLQHTQLFSCLHFLENAGWRLQQKLHSLF